MADDRNMLAPCSDHDRNGYEAAFGKYNIRFQLFHQVHCLGETFDHTERIREIF